MTYSDMKTPPTNITEAPQHKGFAPVPESPRSTTPENVAHEREHNLGVHMKEGMMEKRRAVGCSILTPDFYSGSQLELPAPLLTMEDIQKRFRHHINAWKADSMEVDLSFHEHVEGFQLLDRIGRD